MGERRPKSALLHYFFIEQQAIKQEMDLDHAIPFCIEILKAEDTRPEETTCLLESSFDEKAC